MQYSVFNNATHYEEQQDDNIRGMVSRSPDGTFAYRYSLWRRVRSLEGTFMKYDHRTFHYFVILLLRGVSCSQEGRSEQLLQPARSLIILWYLRNNDVWPRILERERWDKMRGSSWEPTTYRDNITARWLASGRKSRVLPWREECVKSQMAAPIEKCSEL